MAKLIVALLVLSVICIMYVEGCKKHMHMQKMCKKHCEKSCETGMMKCMKMKGCKKMCKCNQGMMMDYENMMCYPPSYCKQKYGYDNN